ncbi:MAG: yibH [Myxococcaceae bacterium]|nr:yibH [Myxococcaceae bacterium]
MNKPSLIVVGVLAAAGLTFAALRADVPRRLGLVQPEAQYVTLYGNVDIRQVELGFRVAGRLAELAFEEGEAVTAGTTLAKLDPRSYRDTVRGAEAEVERRAAALAKLEAGLRPAEIGQARARYQELQADLGRARRDLARQEQLAREGAAPQVESEHARSAVEVASARLASAGDALTLSRQGARSEDIAEARAALSAAQASAAAAQTALADSELQAPSDGIVLSRVRERGAIVGPSDVVYVLSLTKPVWVRAYIAEPLLGRVHPGSEVLVFSDSSPKKPYKGRVGFISPVAEFTPKSVETPELRTNLVYRLRVIIEDADSGLRQDMPVTVRLPSAPAR